MQLSTNNQSGFSVMEIIVAASLFVIFVAGIYQILIFSTKSIHQSARKVEAAYLVQEGIEVVRTLRNNGWAANVAPLVVGQIYYPEIASGSWILSSANPGVLSEIYTRTVVLDTVYRDASDDIASSGDVDPDIRKITVNVSWQEAGISKQVEIETYMSDFLTN